MIRVAAWWALAAALAWLCLGSLLDRLAAQGLLIDTPAAPSFGGAIRAGEAESAWRTGDLPTADRLARAAVARRPVDAATLRLAGSIAIAHGDPGRGDALMRAAGAAGWRDRATQIYWGEAAIEQGAWPIAVDRAEALARLGQFADLRALLRPIEASPVGRAALLRRWREDGDWLTDDYAVWPTGDPVAMANRYAMVMAMRGVLSRMERGRLTAALIPDHVDWAFAIVQPDEHRLVFAESDWTPLDWQLSASPGIDAQVVAGGEKLRVRATGPALLPLADRLVRLPPGVTRLAVPVEGAQSDLPLVATLACVAGQGAAATMIRSANGWLYVDLTVPSGCTAQRLGLAVAGEEARRGADLTVGPPTLSRAAAVP